MFDAIRSTAFQSTTYTTFYYYGAVKTSRSMFTAAVQSLDGAKPNTKPNTNPKITVKLTLTLILT